MREAVVDSETAPVLRTYIHTPTETREAAHRLIRPGRCCQADPRAVQAVARQVHSPFPH
jgi:hypothetical protein